MKQEVQTDILYIEPTGQDTMPEMTPEEAEELQKLQARFLHSYASKKDAVPLPELLRTEMAACLPDRSSEEIAQMSDEILSTLRMQEEKRNSLSQAMKSGRSKESWFESEMKEATSYMSTAEAAGYCQQLDDALKQANTELYHTIHTAGGAVSQNPSLDGFIAEQHHVQTFNLNATAKGSKYRAEVLGPGKNGYGKNSVDIVIKDSTIGKTVRRYQCKYGKNAQATERAFQSGDYRGQRKLVPDGQASTLSKKATSVIESPDGVTSNPLSKADAKALQKEAQSGGLKDLNWNQFQVRDVAKHIAVQTGQATLLGVAVGAGMEVVRKVSNGEEVKAKDLVEPALATGADFGVKVMAAGALKVGVEKGLVKVIPKGTPAGTIANIAHIAVENAKIVGKVAAGEMSIKEGLDQMEATTVSIVAGILASSKGAEIGAKVGSAVGKAVGTVLGPTGAAVGGFIGSTVGYITGSTVGQMAVKVVHKIQDCAIKTFQKTAQKFVEKLPKCRNRRFA